MLLFATLIIIAIALFALEQIAPANELPKVRAWVPRVILINFIQFCIVVVAGVSWDKWLYSVSIMNLRDSFNFLSQGFIAYFISTFVFYWWHRFRHESKFFWRICHQLHHSAQRIELLTSFYKHPVEIIVNSLISSVLVYLILGCSVEGGSLYLFLIAVAEYFYHLNLKTPFTLGYFLQRPESHLVHHRYQHHTQNFADLPIWDILFGTFYNPTASVNRCGFDDWRSDRFEDMLLFKDVHQPGIENQLASGFLPTCIGCKKREACKQSKDNREF